MLRVRSRDPHRVADICGVRAKDIIIIVIIFSCDLSCPLAAKIRVRGLANPVLSQLLLRRRVDRVAPAVPDFFGRGGCGCDLELGLQVAALYEILKEELGDGGTADVAVADE